MPNRWKLQGMSGTQAPQSQPVGQSDVVRRLLLMLRSCVSILPLYCYQLVPVRLVAYGGVHAMCRPAQVVDVLLPACQQARRTKTSISTLLGVAPVSHSKLPPLPPVRRSTDGECRAGDCPQDFAIPGASTDGMTAMQQWVGKH